MRKIKLTKNKYTIVDDSDYEWLNQWKWHYTSHGYAARRITLRKNKSKIIYMHRVIMNTAKSLFTDHINMNGIDNRKVNLRVCNKGDNQRNREKSKTNTSGYKGVGWNSSNKRWVARISVNDKYKYLGSFKNKKDAAMAYNDAAIKYFGEFARLNKGYR